MTVPTSFIHKETMTVPTSFIHIAAETTDEAEAIRHYLWKCSSPDVHIALSPAGTPGIAYVLSQEPNTERNSPHAFNSALLAAKIENLPPAVPLARVLALGIDAHLRRLENKP